MMEKRLVVWILKQILICTRRRRPADVLLDHRSGGNAGPVGRIAPVGRNRAHDERTAVG